MKSKVLEKIKSEWLSIFIVLQPFLDMISYFQTKTFGHSYSWVIRILLFFLLGVITFFKTKEKKKFIAIVSVYIFYLLAHIGNLYRINQLSLFQDVKYYVLVFQMPIMAILLIFYVKATNYNIEKLKKAMAYNIIIIAASIFLALITRTYEYTYIDIGIIGWFNGSNTPSMILCALAPWALYYFYKHSTKIGYFAIVLLVFLLLYFNATRACYLTLLLSLLVMTFCSLFESKKEKRIFNTGILILFIVLSIAFYGCSFTFSKGLSADKNNKENQESIDTIKKTNKNQDDELEINDFDSNNKDEVITILKTSYIYDDLIKLHGEDKVYDIMKDKISNKNLSDNRLRKTINAKIEYDDSDTLTKLLGIGYSRIEKNHLDLENDLRAIFFYYGYIGFAVYLSFIVYMLYIMIKLLARRFNLLKDQEYVILLYLSLLLLAGGEYSGAFLRKPNASIYLSLIYLFSYMKYLSINNEMCNKNNSKISILCLHLGYGGVEEATANLANILSKKYDVEIACTYKLLEKPAFEISNNVFIKYLINGLKPNKEELKAQIRKKNIFGIFKEGIKSIKILIYKKISMINYIQNCDSKIIISTRFSFTKLLSKYGSNKTIRIAQEHCHHNNNVKYIKRVKKSCKNIDYLMPVSKELTDFYDKLFTGSKTEVVYIEHCINYLPEKLSSLDSNDFIAVGRLSKEKGFADLISIFSIINKSNKNIMLHIIGDGNEKENITKKIKELGLESNVKLHGYQNKDYINKLLLKSSLYLMTSYEESFGIVLLEAQSFGIPCIAFDSAQGATEIIVNSKTGILVENRDFDQYAAKTLKLFNDKKKLKEYGLNARKSVEKYYIDNIRKKWLKFIKAILKNQSVVSKNTKNRIIDILFLVFTFSIFSVGFLNVIFNSNEINLYENRKAYKLPDINVISIIDKSYQSNFELAFADQIPLSTYMKKGYNYLQNGITIKLNDILLKDSCNNHYIKLNSSTNIYGCDNNLIYTPVYVSYKQQEYDDRILSINKFLKNNNIDSYFFYVETDPDIDFASNKKTGIYDYLVKNINTDKIYKFEINNFDEYKNYFYKTDHHWNYKGSYKAYTQLVNILTNDTPLEPKAETCLNDNFSGSKANFSGAQRFFKEKFCVYQFNYPKYNIFVNGKVGDYGNQEYHLKNPSSFVSYGSFYGSDNGETIIESGNGKENILVIGESYDNALLKLLASHFNKLYSIDLRTYQRENNKDFNYKKYVEENAIDKVLFIGAKDFYSMKEFNVEVS